MNHLNTLGHLPTANRRSRTLAEVSALGQAFGDPDAFLREFLACGNNELTHYWLAPTE
jgi:hypothetical protein